MQDETEEEQGKQESKCEMNQENLHDHLDCKKFRDMVQNLPHLDPQQRRDNIKRLVENFPAMKTILEVARQQEWNITDREGIIQGIRATHKKISSNLRERQLWRKQLAQSLLKCTKQEAQDQDARIKEIAGDISNCVKATQAIPELLKYSTQKKNKEGKEIFNDHITLLLAEHGYQQVRVEAKECVSLGRWEDPDGRPLQENSVLEIMHSIEDANILIERNTRKREALSELIDEIADKRPAPRKNYIKQSQEEKEIQKDQDKQQREQYWHVLRHIVKCFDWEEIQESVMKREERHRWKEMHEVLGELKNAKSQLTWEEKNRKYKERKTQPNKLRKTEDHQDHSGATTQNTKEQAQESKSAQQIMQKSHQATDKTTGDQHQPTKKREDEKTKDDPGKHAKGSNPTQSSPHTRTKQEPIIQPNYDAPEGGTKGNPWQSARRWGNATSRMPEQQSEENTTSEASEEMENISSEVEVKRGEERTTKKIKEKEGTLIEDIRKAYELRSKAEFDKQPPSEIQFEYIQELEDMIKHEGREQLLQRIRSKYAKWDWKEIKAVQADIRKVTPNPRENDQSNDEQKEKDKTDTNKKECITCGKPLQSNKETESKAEESDYGIEWSQLCHDQYCTPECQKIDDAEQQEAEEKYNKDKQERSQRIHNLMLLRRQAEPRNQEPTTEQIQYSEQLERMVLSHGCRQTKDAVALTAAEEGWNLSTTKQIQVEIQDIQNLINRQKNDEKARTNLADKEEQAREKKEHCEEQGRKLHNEGACEDTSCHNTQEPNRDQEEKQTGPNACTTEDRNQEEKQPESNADTTEDRERGIREQVEYYLSEKNLRTDHMFNRLLRNGNEGYMDIKYIFACNRLRSYKTNVDEMLRALSNSRSVETKWINNMPHIRRKGDQPLPEISEVDKLHKELIKIILGKSLTNAEGEEQDKIGKDTPWKDHGDHVHIEGHSIRGETERTLTSAEIIQKHQESTKSEKKASTSEERVAIKEEGDKDSEERRRLQAAIRRLPTIRAKGQLTTKPRREPDDAEGMNQQAPQSHQHKYVSFLEQTIADATYEKTKDMIHNRGRQDDWADIDKEKILQEAKEVWQNTRQAKEKEGNGGLDNQEDQVNQENKTTIGAYRMAAVHKRNMHDIKEQSLTLEYNICKRAAQKNSKAGIMVCDD